MYVWFGALSPDGSRAVTADRDGTACMWDTATGQELCTLVGTSHGLLVVAPGNNYLSSKAALQAVAFRVGNRALPFDQFDLKYNRPDLVLQRIGLAPKELIDAYHQAYQKRLKRMKFTEEMLGDDFHLPEVAVTTETRFTTRERMLKLKVKASDSKHSLDRLNVYVNGVPVQGTDGIDLRPKKISKWEQEVDVELTPGPNAIQVSALNERGAESLRETFDITCEAPAVKPDLYVIAVGVSKYDDSRFNLTYADKDAKDLADFWESQRQRFGDVKVVRLLNREANQEATRENILKTKELLAKSRVDDQVVLFFSGHGLLDAKWDYYFATVDIDFKDPAKRGLPYEAIEGLLDGIPARKKLLLLDTCHSGEADKADLEPVAVQRLPEGEVKALGIKGGIEFVGKRKLGLANSQQLLQELFADLRRGTGTVVIAASGGREFALESGELNNGVFTFALLQGLKSAKADRNKDGRVQVSELRDYVTEEVRRLTRERQLPNVRRENLDFDFPLN